MSYDKILASTLNLFDTPRCHMAPLVSNVEVDGAWNVDVADLVIVNVALQPM